MYVVLLLLVTALVSLVFSYLVVTVFNVGGKPDEALNRDLEQLFMQIGVQLSVAFFLPLKGVWEIVTDLAVRSTGNVKWLFVFALFAAATIMMHFYHAEVLSIVDDSWTCAAVPLLRNIVTPLLQVSRVIFAIVTPIVNAFIIIQAQILKAWISTFASCSHINLFKIVYEMAEAVTTFTSALSAWFGVDSEIDDDNNFYKNDFNIATPVKHTLAAISIGQEVLACACKRFEPLFNIAFFVVEEPHVTAAIDNGFQTVVRIFQMVFRLLFLDFPDVYRITFKLERAIVESGLAMDSILFNVLQNMIKMISPDFSLTQKPQEAFFTMTAQLAAAAINTAATIGVNGPLHVFSTDSTHMSAFDPEIWSLDRTFSYLHRSVYSVSVLVQWTVYIMERLVTDTVNVMDVFTDENTPLTLNCDWARDVRDHKYVSIGYTAGCSMYNLGISSVNTAAITYGVVVELLTKSIFTQEQNVFRTLQRWEGPHLPRNKVYTCDERKKMTAFDYSIPQYYKEGWVWTQDRAKCGCKHGYGTTLDEFDEDDNKIPFYNPWCGQTSLNFDVFGPLDALVMHVSHGILGPGFGDAFPFITPIRNIEINIQVGSKSIEKSIALPFALPPLTRTAIESMRVLTRVVLSFGDIVTGHFFNYPVNCGHGMNKIQLQAKWHAEHPKSTTTILHDEVMRWDSCKTKAYTAMTKNKRTAVCDKNNDSPGCMCSYLQPLSTQSKCLCIARYPDLDVTSSSQQVGDLIEKRFTSEDVSHHWCNSMIIEWTFQNTAAFADALDYMVSLGPINPTCDVMDRLTESTSNGGLGAKMGERDQRSKSAYLIANTPTLQFTGEFMDASTKLNHIKDLYSETRTGCKIEPGNFVDATDEYGNTIYQQDENGNDIKDKPVEVMTEAEWSCDASENYVSIASLNKLTDDKEEDKPGCRIWGRSDFFCSAGLFVRNSKRLSMNIARQVVNDGISIIAGNFADVNLGTLPRLCDYERQQGAIAAMVAGIIPRISVEMKQAFAKYINMLLQLVFVHSLRTTLVLVNMVTSIIQDIVANPNSVSSDSIEATFKSGVDTLASGYLWAVRYFFDTTGDLLDAVSPGAGDICESIVGIIDMLSEQLKQGLMELVALFLKVFMNLVAALTGDASAIGPFFENAFKLWAEMVVIVIKKMWDILDKVFDFFGPIGIFMKVLASGVCNIINTVLGLIDDIVSSIPVVGASIGWVPMTCVEFSLRHAANHTSGTLGKHFLRSSDDEDLPRRVAETLEWNGTSVCDHFMSAAADYSYTDLRPLEKATWLECIEYKLIGVEIAKFVGSARFPTDLVYNWKRKYILMYEFSVAMKIIIGEYVASGKTDWAQIRMLLYDAGLDADIYIRLSQKFISVSGTVLHTIEFTNVAEFLFEKSDPEFKNANNPSSTAVAWKSLNNAKDMYTKTSNTWVEKDMSKQLWTAVDASYEAHTHLQNWWSSIGTDVPAQQTHTERVFANLKNNLQSIWKERVYTTKLHRTIPFLRTPIKTGIQSCFERDNPGWCTECAVMDNLIETLIEQGSEIGYWYSGERKDVVVEEKYGFPHILNNVSGYFNKLAEYNKDFFEGTFSRLQSGKGKVPKTKIRWTYHVKRDWSRFFSAFGTFIINGSALNGTIVDGVVTNETHTDIWLKQIDRLLAATRQFVSGGEGEYVPFFGYSFYHMYDWLLFSSCDMKQSIYVITTTEDERLVFMDSAIITCLILILIIITNTTWSVIPLVWMANTIVIWFIVHYVYLYMVYGYFPNCSPVIPITLMEDINAWYHTRVNPGCFYKALPFMAVNASEDTCLTCQTRQIYTDCAKYTIANFEDGMLPLSELIEDYFIAWPFLFWIRWKWPSIAIFVVRNGLVRFESVLGRLAMGAWQQEPVDPVWIDCYNAMWLDNVLVGVSALVVGYVGMKLSIVMVQTMVQMVILVMYTYTTLSYMSLAVEKSVVVN